MRKFLGSRFYILNSRSGFTVIELLIFSAIFSIIAVSFFGVLVSVIQIQMRQTAVVEVNQQSQFLLETIQRSVERSSFIELSSDAATTTLKLRMASSTVDPTYIYLSGTAVYYKETDSGTVQALTSDKVNVSNLSFTKRANPPGHDSVNVVFTIAYNTSNIKRAFLQNLQISVARVSAAAFDSNVIPAANNTYNLGVTSQTWQSVNNLIYFSGSNVGIGVSSPGQTLEVNGGVRLNTTTAKPTCDSAQRGTFWVVESGSGVKDSAQVCVKNASDMYIWSVIY